MLTMTREQATKLLIGCGFRKLQVEGDNKKLARKLLTLPDVIEKNAELENQDSDLLLKDVLAEIGGEKKIEVVDATESDEAVAAENTAEDPLAEETLPAETETADAPQVDSKAEAAAKKKAEKESAAAKKKQDTADKKRANVVYTAVEKDRFGFREGTKASKMAACLSIDVPKSMKELVTESGIETSQPTPLGDLVSRGVVKKTDDKKYLLVEA